MSKGSQKIVVRLPGNLYPLLLTEVQIANDHSKGLPLGLSDWVRKAICEKLQHLKRGRLYRTKKMTEK